MDMFKKYLNNTAIFPIDYITNYLHLINEKPLSSVLAPITLAIFCCYIYVYIRKFYPISVNCWFCNANFKVAFEDRFEFTCIECRQFNGFKKDGSYSKTIPEQHDERFNMKVFTVIQNDVKKSKNGLCHKCNIIQEMKIKQLAAFTPINENNFDREIEIFKENLEETLKLCSECNIFSKKILSLQEQRYSLRSIRINNQMNIRDVSDWPHVCSLFLSTIVLLLSSGAKNYLSDWTEKFIDPSIFDNSVVTTTNLISIASLIGMLCQAYHGLTTMDKLTAIVMLLWSSLFAINNFEIFINFKPKLLVSVLIVFLSSIPILKNFTSRQQIRQTSIKLEDETYDFPTTNYCDISTNGSVKNSNESEMMDIDYTEESPQRVKKLNKTVNNLFQGMKLNDNRGIKNNFIRPSKLFMPAKRDKFAGYAETSLGYYPPYSMKDDYEYDTQSVYSQHSYRSQCSALCHQAVSPYTYYAPNHHQQQSPLNLSHASNTSNIQQTSEWSKMLIYSIPGIILLTLQCYLLHDIKDYMKQN